MKRHHLLHLPGSAVIFLAFSGCQAISSFEDGKDGPRAGITYYLPKTEYKVSLSVDPEYTNDNKLKQVTLGMSCEPVFIADKTAGAFTMHSSANEFFARHHTLAMEDGLLTSTAINDDGRLLEIMKKLGDTAALVAAARINPMAGAPPAEEEDDEEDEAGAKSLAVAGGGPLDLDPEDDFPYQELIDKLPTFPNLADASAQAGGIIPTKEETEAVLAAITPGDHEWHFRDFGGSYQVPGAAGAVSITFSSAGGGSGKGGPLDTGAIAAIRARNCGTIPGIVARNTTKTGINITLAAEKRVVAEMRLAKVRANLDALEKYREETTAIKLQFDKQSAALGRLLEGGGIRNNGIGNFSPADLKKTRQSKNQIDRARDGMATGLAVAAKKEGINKGLKDLYSLRWSETVLLKSHMMAVSSTIDERAVVIPLTRGPVGQTTHTVTLAHGVVTDWEFDKKSAVEGLIDIPIELTRDIVGIPAAAVTAKKTDLAAKKDLVDAEAALVTSRAALVEAQASLEEARNGKGDDDDEEDTGDEEDTDGEGDGKKE